MGKTYRELNEANKQRKYKKLSKEIIQKIKQRLRAITLQGAIGKRPILLK